MAWEFIRNQIAKEETGTGNQVLIINSKGVVWGGGGGLQMKKHKDIYKQFKTNKKIPTPATIVPPWPSLFSATKPLSQQPPCCISDINAHLLGKPKGTNPLWSVTENAKHGQKLIMPAYIA